jgi:hypothetical protein
MKFVSRIASGLTLLCVLLLPVNIFSSGAWIETTFVLQRGPDGPMKAFNAGKLGILWPQFAPRYLVIAYRYLEHKPLTAEEQQSLDDAAKPRITPPGASYDPDPLVTAWLNARNAALGLQGVTRNGMDRYRTQGFVSYPNCGDDAFINAASTARARAQTFGIASPLMREWVAGQDAVFQNCGAGMSFGPYQPRPPDQPRRPPDLPPAVTLDSPLLRFDRQYQVAAANFYGGDLDAAANAFEQIAHEPDSPWRKLAPYLVARCYIRKATIGVKGENSFLPEPMRNAEQRLQAILADKSLASMHPVAQRLLDYVEARLDPEQRLHAIAAQLATGAGPQFERELFDYIFLLNHPQAQQEQGPEVQKTKESATNAETLDDLTDWVGTYLTEGAGVLIDGIPADQYRFERWQAKKSTPWLLSVLVSMHASDPHAAEVEQAAAMIGAGSHAYDTALYHRVRLLEEKNQDQQARKLLDANWARIEKDSPSNRNAFLAQRFAVATSFQEFLRFAPRTPVVLEDTIGKYPYVCEDGSCRSFPPTAPVIEPPPQRLEVDSVRIFNQRLPLSLLVQAANGTALPADLRDELAARTWLRAVLIDNTAAVRALQPHVLAKYPEMRSYIAQYDRADSAEARRFALVFMVMHFSALQPFVNAGALGSVIRPGIWTYSWWCYDVGAAQGQGPYGSVMFSPAPGAQSKSEAAPPPPPSWLTPAERERAEREWHNLSEIGAAPMYFAPVVLGWAKTHPDDPRVPEALHYFVRATRYGCVDKSIGRYSREAFDLLHRKYPKSEWTKNTPHWFD